MNRLAHAATHPGRLAMAVCAVACLGFSIRAPDLAAAQTAEQRRAIEAYSDSLEAMSDSTALKREETALLAAARYNRSDPFFHLRLAYLGLRLGELGGAAHYDDAASEFRAAAQLEPRWPYAWFGLGRAEFALGARASGGEQSILAQDAWSRAATAFARAASLESGFAARLEELARPGTAPRVDARAGIVREALLRASAGRRAPRLLLALGRVQREMGDSLALATFDAFVRASDSSALSLMELGRARLLHGRLDGLELYLRAASTDDPVAIQEFRSDLLPLATPAELADFDLRRGVSRADMVRRFWRVRDRLELREDGERLGEHLRRVAVARKEFLVAGGAGMGSERLDDRGRVYIRHGPPDDRAGLNVPGVEPNESWRYRRNGGDVLLHFAARRSPTDFRLVESLLDVEPVRAQVEGSSGLGAGVRSGTEQLVRSRAPLSPLYREPPTGNAEALAQFLARERGAGRRGIQFAGGSDSYPKAFPRSLGAWGAILIAGSEQGIAPAQVVFAIPVTSVEPRVRGEGVEYPVRVRFVAINDAGAIAAQADTVVTVRASGPIASNRTVNGRIAVRVPPGRLLARASVEYGDSSGTVFAPDTLRVPDLSSSELELGDVLLGSRPSGIPLRFDDGLTMNLAAGGAVHRSEELDLAVEVFGLRPGAAAQVRVLLAAADDPEAADEASLRWRAFPQGKTSARLSAPKGGGVVRWRVLLPLGRLQAGEWMIAVEATDSRGRLVRRTAPLTVKLP
jgi:GWxTD domain-containing protein